MQRITLLSKFRDNPRFRAMTVQVVRLITRVSRVENANGCQSLLTDTILFHPARFVKITRFLCKRVLFELLVRLKYRLLLYTVFLKISPKSPTIFLPRSHLLFFYPREVDTWEIYPERGREYSQATINIVNPVKADVLPEIAQTF